jgi:hypothetical protein
MIAALLSACGGGSAGTAAPTQADVTSRPVSTDTAPGGLPSAEELCALLDADDWGQFGYVTAASPSINSDGPGSAYCVYAGTSGASGGLELDAFAHETEADSEATFETMTAESPGATPIDLVGADAALITKGDDYAFIVVRIGRFAFTIALPAEDDAEQRLTTLANRVIDQSASYR